MDLAIWFIGLWVGVPWVIRKAARLDKEMQQRWGLFMLLITIITYFALGVKIISNQGG